MPILERFRRWRASLPGNGYSALTEMPAGDRPPRDTGVPPRREDDGAYGYLTLTLILGKERDTAIQERDEARAMAREILNADPHCDRNAWVRRCPWLAER